MPNSIKQMYKDGTIKRPDGRMLIRLDDIHVKPGFNKREDDERTRQADDDLFNFLMSGGAVPPLEIVAREDGGVWVIEGHRRRRCYERCRAEGKSVEWISITPFTGNDVERIARVMTSNNQLPLTPLEQSAVVRELAAFNLSVDEIAKLVHKSRPTVEKLLALSTANHDVQQMVKSGDVAMDVAIAQVKERGDSAGEVLAKEVEKAKAAGIKKVTKRVIAPQFDIKKARLLAELLAGANLDFRTVDGRPLISLNAEDHEKVRLLVEDYRLFKNQASHD